MKFMSILDSSALNLSKICIAMSCVFVVTGCEKKPVVDTQEVSEMTAIVATQSPIKAEQTFPILNSTLQLVSVQAPKCQEKNCPQIQIQRLHTNYNEIDILVDQYIAQYIKKVVQSFRLKDESAALAAEQNRVAHTQADENAIDAKVAPPSDAQKLASQLQPDVDKFIELSNEVKSLGGTSQLSLYIKPQVLNTKGPLVSVVMNASNYIGGAHGSTTQQYINFDLNENRAINLDGMIQHGQRKQFNELVYAKFKAWVADLQPETELSNYEELWTFKVSENFYLGNKSLILQYGEYEIGPYVVGLPRLEIPYEELITILKPQYLPVAEEDVYVATDPKVSAKTTVQQ